MRSRGANGLTLTVRSTSFVDGAQVLWNGSARATDFVGSIVFGDTARSRFASALPLMPTLINSMLFGQLTSSDKWFTGIALLNPNHVAANMTIEM